DPFENHRILAHRSSDESPLTGKSGRGAFANNPQLLAAMRFQPREVVIIVNLMEDGGAENFYHPVANPVPAGVGVAPGEIHAGDVFFAERRIDIQHDRIDVDAVFASALTDEVCRDLVTETAGPEMNADPDTILFVVKNIDVV